MLSVQSPQHTPSSTLTNNHATAIVYPNTLAHKSRTRSTASVQNTIQRDPQSKHPIRKDPNIDDEMAQSSILMSRLKHIILNSVKEDKERSRHQFSTGMDTLDGQRQRQEWLRIENELHRVQGLASRSVQATNIATQQELLGNIRGAVADAMHFIVDGVYHGLPLGSSMANPFHLRVSNAEMIGKDHMEFFSPTVGVKPSSSQLKPFYMVWSSANAARSAILQEAIANMLRGPGRNYLLKARPLLILAVERNSTTQQRGSHAQNCEIPSEQNTFLLAWTRASFGIAEIITVGAASSNKLRVAIESVLRCAADKPSVVPVLVCIHASASSILPSELSLIRTVCNTFHTQLCVEGSALAMIAQPNRPSDPDEAVTHSNVLLLDPGAWFGFKMCAVITRHEKSFEQEGKAETHHGRFQPLSSAIISRSEGDHQVALGPILNLWTVLSRVGLARIRSMIDESTALAETFLHSFEDSNNIETLYESIGCSVLVSYAMSRDDRLMTRQKAIEKISNINNILHANLETSSNTLPVQKIILEEKVYLQFCPVRLLGCGTLWTPPTEAVNEYAQKIQDVADKYEACRAGCIAFEGKAGNCRDLELVLDEQGELTLPLCFGAFRVVPYELCTSWRETSPAIDVVKDLTNLLIEELQESIEDLVAKSFLLQQEIEKSGVASKILRSKQQRKVRQESDTNSRQSRAMGDGLKNSCEAYSGLPFVVYLNSDLDNGVPDFLSVEPREPCRAVEAVRQARLAAELIVASVNAITCRWRGSNMISHIPRDLANVAGNENFIPLTVTREGLGRTNHTADFSGVKAPNVLPNEENVITIDDDSMLHEAETSSDSDEFYSLQGSCLTSDIFDDAYGCIIANLEEGCRPNKLDSKNRNAIQGRPDTMQAAKVMDAPKVVNCRPNRIKFETDSSSTLFYTDHEENTSDVDEMNKSSTRSFSRSQTRSWVSLMGYEAEASDARGRSLGFESLDQRGEFVAVKPFENVNIAAKATQLKSGKPAAVSASNRDEDNYQSGGWLGNWRRASKKQDGGSREDRSNERDNAGSDEGDDSNESGEGSEGMSGRGGDEEEDEDEKKHHGGSSSGSSEPDEDEEESISEEEGDSDSEDDSCDTARARISDGEFMSSEGALKIAGEWSEGSVDEQRGRRGIFNWLRGRAGMGDGKDRTVTGSMEERGMTRNEGGEVVGEDDGYEIGRVNNGTDVSEDASEWRSRLEELESEKSGMEEGEMESMEGGDLDKGNYSSEGDSEVSDKNGEKTGGGFGLGWLRRRLLGGRREKGEEKANGEWRVDGEEDEESVEGSEVVEVDENGRVTRGTSVRNEFTDSESVDGAWGDGESTGSGESGGENWREQDGEEEESVEMDEHGRVMRGTSVMSEFSLTDSLEGSSGTGGSETEQGESERTEEEVVGVEEVEESDEGVPEEYEVEYETEEENGEEEEGESEEESGDYVRENEDDVYCEEEYLTEGDCEDSEEGGVESEESEETREYESEDESEVERREAEEEMRRRWRGKSGAEEKWGSGMANYFGWLTRSQKVKESGRVQRRTGERRRGRGT